jgi:L-arabinonolactonase
MMHKVDVAARTRAILGECPIWEPEERRLYWTDVFGETIYRLASSTGAVEAIPLPCRVNSFGFREGGGLIAANWTGLSFIDLSDRTVEQFWTLPDEPSGFFLNDGRCDRAGRYWAGSVCSTYDLPGARLYAMGQDRIVRRKSRGLLASNGLAFSPDDSVLYYSDSPTGIIWAFDFDLTDGVATNRRVFAKMQRPDGATVDADGCYWAASFGHSEVIRFTPDGKIDRKIELPTSQVSMCAFGGDNLDILFVTTGTFRLTPEQEAAQDLAGAVFAVTGLGTCGLPEPRFKG